MIQDVQWRLKATVSRGDFVSDVNQRWMKQISIGAPPALSAVVQPIGARSVWLRTASLLIQETATPLLRVCIQGGRTRRREERRGERGEERSVQGLHSRLFLLPAAPVRPASPETWREWAATGACLTADGVMTGEIFFFFRWWQSVREKNPKNNNNTHTHISAFHPSVFVCVVTLGRYCEDRRQQTPLPSPPSCLMSWQVQRIWGMREY